MELAIRGKQQAIRALANPIRRRIMELLREGEMSVNALADQFDVARPGVSRHLRVLREAGLVTFRSDHKARLYSLDPGEMDRFRREFDADFRDFWRPQGSETQQVLPEAVESDLQQAFEISIAAELPVRRERAYAYVTEDALFSQWVGEDARSDPRVGGTITATSAFGGRLVAEFCALVPHELLVLRVLEPLDPQANLYTIAFEPVADAATRVTLRHFVRDEGVANLVRMAWGETWKLLLAFAEGDAGAKP